MPNAGLDPVLRHARRLAGEESPDDQLLQRFAQRQDAGAFEALIRRHGGLVWRICRRVLGNAQDAEDSFQATWLVLARRASSIRKPRALASWLHGAAFRIARKARRAAQRRDSRPGLPQHRAVPDPGEEAAWRELGRLVEEEVNALAEKYRAAILLCYWEGLTTEEAARRLGCPQGTVKTRLGKARELLQQRLARRGVTLPAGVIVTLLAPGLADAASPPAQVAVTTRTALAFHATQGSGAPMPIPALAEGGLRGTSPGKAMLGMALLVAGALATGAGALLRPPSRALGPGAKAEVSPNATARTDRFGDPLPPGAIARLGTIRQRSTASALAFAPGGQNLLTAGGHRSRLTTLGRWDSAKGVLRGETHLAGPAEDGHWFSADGRTLAVAERDGLSLWDTASGKRRRLLPVEATAATFAPDGRVLATAEYAKKGGRVRLWELATGKGRLLAELPSYVDGLALGPGGKRVFIAVNNHALCCWDTALGRPVWRKEHWASILAVSPDGRTLCTDGRPLRPGVALGSSGNLHFWEVETGRYLGSLGQGRRGTYQLAFAPDGRTLAEGRVFGRGTQEVVLWDLRTRRLRHRLPEAGPNLAFSPDGQSLVTLGALLDRWEVATGKPLYPDTRSHGHFGVVVAVAFAPEGRSLATCAEDGSIRLWDLATGRHRQLREDAPRYRMRARGSEGTYIEEAAPLEFTQDGRLLLSDLASGALVLTEVRTSKEVRRFALPAPRAQAFGRAVATTRFTEDGRALLALGQTYRMSSTLDLHPREPLRGWDLATGREVLSGVIRDVATPGPAFSPDGQFLILGEPCKLREVGSKEERRLQGSTGSLAAPFAFSSDGRLVAALAPGRVSREGRVGFTGDRRHLPGKTVCVHEVLSGRELMRVPAALGYCPGLVFSPDGRLLAAPGSDALHVWESSTGRLLLHLPARGRLNNWTGAGFATCLGIAPDSGALATGHADGTVLLWDLTGARQRLIAPPGPVNPAACWADLAIADPRTAYRAIDRLSVSGDRALPLLRRGLAPEKIDQRWLAARLADLDNDSFATREAATRELTRIAETVEAELRHELGRSPSLEVRRRLQRILGFSRLAVPAPGVLRRLRAVVVLERIGSEEARRLLRELAAGAPQARLTRAAKASLERLARRPRPSQ
jgi:RNA polymerase sigma factor (sigma-70 family)